jgi:hypothetical protein
LIRKSGVHNIKNARYRAALDLDFALEFVGISWELNSPVISPTTEPLLISFARRRPTSGNCTGVRVRNFAINAS